MTATHLGTAVAAVMLLAACGTGQGQQFLTHPDPAGGTIHLRPGVHYDVERLCQAFGEQVVPRANGVGSGLWSVEQMNRAAVAVLGRTMAPWDAYPPRQRLATCWFEADRIDDLTGLPVTTTRGHFSGEAVVDWHGRWTPHLARFLDD